MDSADIQRFEAEEAELARSDAQRALAGWTRDKDPVRLLRTIYGFDNRQIGSFLNTGSLETALFGARHPAIVTIFPFPEEKDLHQAYGVTAQRLDELIAEKHVIPLIQPPTRYEKLTYLHRILRHRPRNYFLRSVYFYAIFFDGTIDLVENEGVALSPGLDQLYERAKQNKVLDRILTNDYAEVREFYDRLPFGSEAEKQKRIKENIRYRYASVAAFLDEDVTDYILETYTEQKTALGVLLDLHFLFDHAWTQGLLATMHNTKEAHNRDWLSAWMPTPLWWQNAFNRVLCVDIPFHTLREPRLDQLEAAREEGHHDALERSIEEKSRLNVDELKADLRWRIAEIEDRVDRVAAVGQKILIYRNVSSVVFGGAAALLPPSNPVTPVLGALGGFVAPSLLKQILDSHQRRMRKHNVGAHVVGHLSNVWAARPLLSHG